MNTFFLLLSGTQGFRLLRIFGGNWNVIALHNTETFFIIRFRRRFPNGVWNMLQHVGSIPTWFYSLSWGEFLVLIVVTLELRPEMGGTTTSHS